MGAKVDWFLVPLVSAALVSLAAVVGSAETRSQPQLSELSVPPERLPEGCVMPANDRGMRRLPEGATNPWSPSARHDVMTIHRMIVGLPRVPDGPPPMPAEARRGFGELVPSISEAYAAFYATRDEPDIRVWAIRYTERPAIPDERRRAYRIREHLTSGSVLAVIDASDRGPCFEAVRGHLRRLMAR